MKIIINSHIDNEIAVSLVCKAISSNEKALERECVWLFNIKGKDIIVASIKNKNSMRFEVYNYKENNNG